MPKSSFLLHHEQAEIFQAMSFEQAGKLLLYLFDYSENGTQLPESEHDQAIKFSFLAIKIRIDADAEHYRSVCKKRSVSGALGGMGKAKANAFAESKKSKTKQKKLSDSDSDSDAESKGTKTDARRLASTPERSGDHSGEEAGLVPVGPPVISLPLNDGSEYHVSAQQAAEYAALFPAVDVPQALRSMRAWLDSNPTNRKTPRGVRRFITGWLDREQNRARPSPQATATYGGMRVQTVRDGQTVARDQMAKAVLAQRAKEQGLHNANRTIGTDSGRSIDNPGCAVHALPE